MSSTVTLQTTLSLSRKFVHDAPLLYTNDGALVYSIADSVRQFILSPPFSWRWNRTTMTITTVAGQSDYSFTLPDFGWLEKATIFYPVVQGQNPPQISKELTIVSSLVPETVAGQPAYISVVGDDNNGNITLRLMMVPDNTYNLYLVYQRSSPSFTSLSDTWSPLPDYFRYIYEKGFLARVYEYKDDERFPFTHMEFLKSVVAASDGITEEQKNIFLGPRLVTQRETQNVTQSGSIARQGRVGM